MEFLRLEVTDHIAKVTLSRPPVNAITFQIYNEVAQMFTDLHYRTDVWAVIFCADGKWFSSGNDVSELGLSGAFSKVVKEMGITSEDQMVELYRDALRASMTAIYTCRKPVIAAIQGYCLGAGLAFVTCCDFIVAADNALIGIPEANVGVIGAAGFAQMLVPDKVARYMAYTGKSFKAEEIARYGSIHRVVPVDRLLDEARALAVELTKNAPVTVQSFKMAINTYTAPVDRLVEKYNAEQSYSDRIRSHPDVKEALTAFSEKRPPKFTG